MHSEDIMEIKQIIEGMGILEKNGGKPDTLIINRKLYKRFKKVTKGLSVKLPKNHPHI